MEGTTDDTQTHSLSVLSVSPRGSSSLALQMATSKMADRDCLPAFPIPYFRHLVKMRVETGRWARPLVDILEAAFVNPHMHHATRIRSHMTSPSRSVDTALGLRSRTTLFLGGRNRGDNGSVSRRSCFPPHDLCLPNKCQLGRTHRFLPQMAFRPVAC